MLFSCLNILMASPLPKELKIHTSFFKQDLLPQSSIMALFIHHPLGHTELLLVVQYLNMTGFFIHAFLLFNSQLKWPLPFA